MVRRGSVSVTSVTLLSYFTLLFMLKLEVIEMCSCGLLLGLDLHDSKKGLTSCGVNKVQFSPISLYQIRLFLDDSLP